MKLKDQIYRLSVGEPWNFEGPDGQNLIIGTIIRQESTVGLVFKTIKPITVDNHTGNILILTPRYTLTKFDFSNERVGTFNVSIYSGEYSDDLEINILIENSYFSIIGGLSK